MTDGRPGAVERPTVLFIAGDGRSGSTILHNLLGQLPAVMAVGEVREIWDRGFGRDYLCGCERLFRECPMWNAVAEDAFGGMEQVPFARLSQLTEEFRSKDLPLALLPRVGERKLSQVRELIEALTRLYLSVARVTGSDVIVDSSKNPSFGYLVKQIEQVDMKVLHFVRDGRAVAYSWLQRSESQPGKTLRRQSVPFSSLQWSVRNLTAELFLRDQYRRLRYEDFLARPEEELRSVARWIGRDDVPLPVSGHTAHLTTPNHSVFGNGVRFANGEVSLVEDRRWLTAMTPGERRVAASLTLPIRLRYGYVEAGRPGK